MLAWKEKGEERKEADGSLTWPEQHEIVTDWPLNVAVGASFRARPPDAIIPYLKKKKINK